MSRTSVGRDFVSDAMFKSPQPNPAVVLALGDANVAVPAQGSNAHTTMGGNTTTEARTDGLGRKVGTYTHTAGTQTSTLQATFTNSAASGANPHTIYLVGVFSPVTAGVAGAVDTGTLVFEMAEPNPPVLSGTDAVNQTVSIDYGA